MQEAASIPIIRLWRLLLVPLQGDVTDASAEAMSAELLDRVHREGASGVIIDITALWMIDSHLCALLSRVAAATALMGTKTVICGLKPDIALTLEMMGISLNNVVTTLNLEEALRALGAHIRFDDAKEERLHRAPDRERHEAPAGAGLSDSKGPE